MPYTDEELQSLYNPLQPATSTSGPSNFFAGAAKLGEQLGNVLPQIGNNLFQDAVGAYGTLLPGSVTQEDVNAAGNVAPKFDVGPSTGIKDVILNDVLPKMAEWAVPYGAISKGAHALIGGGIVAEALAQGGANAFTEMAAPDGTPGATGLMGAASGALQAALPRWQRALPLAAVSGLAYADSGSALQAGANFIGNMLPGAFKEVTVAKFIPKEIPPEVKQIFGSTNQPGNFSFMDQVSQAPGHVGFDDMQHFGSATPPPDLQLAPPQQLDLNFPEILTPTTPSDLQLNHYGGDIQPQSLELPQPALSGLQLEGAKYEQPTLHPLLDLQGETLDPNINFKLINRPETSTLPVGEATDLFGWRNQAIEQKPEFPLLTDRASTIEPPPVGLTSDIEPISGKSTTPFPTPVKPPTTTPTVPSSPVEIPPISEVEAPPLLIGRIKVLEHTTPDGQVHLIEPQYSFLQTQRDARTSTKTGRNGWTTEIKENGQKEWNQAFEDKVSTKQKAIQRAIDYLDSQYPATVKTPTKVDAPQVMLPSGELTTLPPRMDGPHIISTVLDEGDGNYLAGNKWNDPHQKGGNAIFMQHIANASGTGDSAFLVHDENGIQRVTKDRVEALKIAQQAGQTEQKGGGLQSEHLIDPLPKAGQSPAEVLQGEKASDANDIATLRGIAEQKLANAKPGLETKIASRQYQELLETHYPEEAAARAAKVTGGEDIVDAPMAKDTGKKGMLRATQRKFSQSGQISPELAGILALGGVGGAVGYYYSKGDIGSTIAMTFAGMGLAFGGSKAIGALKGRLGPAGEVLSTKYPSSVGLKEKLAQFAINTSRTPGGNAVAGRGGIYANAVREAEMLLGNRPEFQDVRIRAGGFIANQLNHVQALLDKAKVYTPNSAFIEAGRRAFRGALVDKATVEGLINSGGGMAQEAFYKLSPKDKLAYPEKWMVFDDPNTTNTKGRSVSLDEFNKMGHTDQVSYLNGREKNIRFEDFQKLSTGEQANYLKSLDDGVTIYKVSNKAKAQLNKMQEDALTRLVSSKEDSAYLPLVLQMRQSADAMMQVIHMAAGEGPAANRIVGTMGQYATRTLNTVSDLKAYPDEALIQRGMQRLSTQREVRFLDEHASPTTANKRTMPIQYEGKTYFIDPEVKSDWNNLHTPEQMRSLVAQKLKEIRSGKTLSGFGGEETQLGGSLFQGRKDLDEVTLALLGHEEAPLQVMQNTLNKLAPQARSAYSMLEFAKIPDSGTGLSGVFSKDIEYNKALNGIKQELLNPSLSPVEKQKLQTKYQELSNYIPISGQNPKLGIYQGAYVSRAVHDQLNGYEGPFGYLDSAIGKGMTQFNQFVKRTHTTLNPIVYVRNAFQVPMFLAMGGAAHDVGAWKGAIEGMSNPLSKVGRRLTLNGAFEGNALHGELANTIDEIVSGKADQNLWDKIQKGHDYALKVYASFDNFTRAAVYLAAENRFAKKFNVSVDANDPRVMEAARMFMSRRTMDYANVPNIVKFGRTVPFVSMFLSYTSEVVRITKNMTVDALHGDLAAAGTLGGLAAMPLLLQNAAVNNLSPVDRADWLRGQNVVADYSRPRFKMPLSRNKDGSFNYLDITPLFIHNDFEMVARAAIQGDWRAALATNPYISTNNTPLLNLGAAIVTGKNERSGRTLRDAGDYATEIAQDILPPHTPGVGTEYQKVAPEALGGQLGVTNLKSGRTATIEGALTRHLLGVDMTQINSDVAMKTFVGQAKQDIADERQYFMDVMRSTANADSKERATKRYINAVQEITNRMQNRMQLVP